MTNHTRAVRQRVDQAVSRVRAHEKRVEGQPNGGLTDRTIKNRMAFGPSIGQVRHAVTVAAEMGLLVQIGAYGPNGATTWATPEGKAAELARRSARRTEVRLEDIEQGRVHVYPGLNAAIRKMVRQEVAIILKTALDGLEP